VLGVFVLGCLLVRAFAQAFKEKSQGLQVRHGNTLCLSAAERFAKNRFDLDGAVGQEVE